MPITKLQFIKENLEKSLTVEKMKLNIIFIAINLKKFLIQTIPPHIVII